VHRQHQRYERGRGRGTKSGRPGAFSPGAPLISSLSLSLSLSHPPLIPGGMWNPPQCSSFIPCKVGLCRTPSHGRGTRAPGRSQREGQSLHQAFIKSIVQFSALSRSGLNTSTIDLLGSTSAEWGARTGVFCEMISVKSGSDSHRGGGSPE
jgi:hypothetical protein